MCSEGVLVLLLGSVIKDQCNDDMHNPIDQNRLIMEEKDSLFREGKTLRR